MQSEEPEQKGQRTSPLNELTRSETVRKTQPAPLPIILELNATHDREIRNPVIKPQKKSILFPAVVPTSTEEWRNSSMNTVKAAQALSFPTADTDVVVMAKPTDKIGIAYDKFDNALHTAVFHLRTGAGVLFILSALIPPKRRINVMKESSPRFRTASKQQLQTKAINMLYLCIGDVCTRVWLGAPKLAFNLFSTAFIYRILRGIFPSKRKVVPWNASPITKHTNPEPDYNVNGAQETKENPKNMSNRSEETSIIQVARKKGLKTRNISCNGHYESI